ncbi:phage/plasmid primase, P4 family [Allostreptomyces psammosilenae]|uniref:Putative DNA primase/helicase n=1 Tax=Allostreptomyces psammosilenae TaxID=1892865 RepID=A0A852ZV02_9ACTN|nr:phage/plasmid primase, P4 family [Allostreptomyces psammosilenae]NYI06089.1 putative DNA primase/helicase [Allostreptomyces psammosilenae]
MKFLDILNRFSEVSEHGDGGYTALCPAHCDTRPSLRIWRGEDNKVRLTCRAGCATRVIISKVRLEWVDLFDVEGEGNTVPKGRPSMVGITHIAALANYVDATRDELRAGGEGAYVAELYALERFGVGSELAYEMGLGYDPGDGYSFEYLSRTFKAYPRLTVPLYDFRGVPRGLQGRDLSGKCPGRWVSLMNPEGFRWAPYGVFRGQGGYGVTLVTEGPGDGLTGVSVGYDVVMVRGAALAGNPDLLAEIAEGVKGTQVIACGDNDEAGLRFNQSLAEGLKPYGIDVYQLRIPDFGPKTDLTDWREADPSSFPEHLHRAVKAAVPVKQAAEAQAEAVSEELSEATGADMVTRDQGHDAARILAGLLERYGDTDAMNAHALVAWSDGRIKYAPGLGFYVWNGRTWERSEVKVRQEIHRMGAALVLAGKVKEARGFTMTTRINDLMTELRSVPTVYVDAAEFDNRPHLLSFRNGTIDLRTGELRPHSKDDMLTYCLSVNYDASAQCPRWEAFLEEIMPGRPEMPAYLQRLIGYGITGCTDEQCFAVLWGKGANGKSVFTDTLYKVFRPISQTTPFATFEEKPSGGIPNDIAMLRGSRLVMASEGESGKPMSEAVLKRVTGKDMIAARFLRQEFFEFKPSFLLMLATNHKPKFRGQDEGLWRRVKMIAFERWFAPHERDYSLDAKLEAEAEGIAAWAVRGAVQWYASGLQDPAVITKATTEYKETSDALAGFFPGVLVRDESARMDGADAYTAYRDWCEAEGLPGKEVWSRRAFYEAMGERGITRTRVSRGMALVGVRLADPALRGGGPGIFGSD